MRCGSRRPHLVQTPNGVIPGMEVDSDGVIPRKTNLMSLRTKTVRSDAIDLKMMLPRCRRRGLNSGSFCNSYREDMFEVN